MSTQEKYIVAVNALAALGFGLFFVLSGNYEFIIYVGVIIAIGLLIGMSMRKISYPPLVLWLLTIWALGHMAGGTLFIGDTRLYEIIFIDLVGAPFHILKYDQVIHAYGFFVATLVMYVVLRPLLNTERRPFSLILVLAMAGLGLGAFNEIIEFGVTLVDPTSGVGGYHNTSLDLVANFIGTVCAGFYIVHFPRSLE